MGINIIVVCLLVTELLQFIKFPFPKKGTDQNRSERGQRVIFFLTVPLRVQMGIITVK